MTIWVLQITDSTLWLLEPRFRRKVEPEWKLTVTRRFYSWKGLAIAERTSHRACLPMSRNDMCTFDVLFQGFQHVLLHHCVKQFLHTEHELGPSWGSEPCISLLIPQTGWLKTEIYSLTVLEARSSWPQYGQGLIPSRCSRREHLPCLFQLLMAAGIAWFVAASLQHLPLWSHCLFLSQNSLCLSP